jgi:hypothetical protein
LSSFWARVEGAGARTGDEIPTTARPASEEARVHVRRKAELEELSRIFSNQRLVRLAEALEAVNPKAVKSNSRLTEV